VARPRFIGHHAIGHDLLADGWRIDAASSACGHRRLASALCHETETASDAACHLSCGAESIALTPLERPACEPAIPFLVIDHCHERPPMLADDAAESLSTTSERNGTGCCRNPCMDVPGRLRPQKAQDGELSARKLR